MTNTSKKIQKETQQKQQRKKNNKKDNVVSKDKHELKREEKKTADMYAKNSLLVEGFKSIVDYRKFKRIIVDIFEIRNTEIALYLSKLIAKTVMLNFYTKLMLQNYCSFSVELILKLSVPI